MKNYLSSWNFMRVLRLAIGLYIVVEGVRHGDWLFTTLGGLFALMPLLNLGCNGATGCSIPAAKSNRKTEDVTYDEVI